LHIFFADGQISKCQRSCHLIYHHRCSYPAKDSSRLLEREMMFSTTREASTIHHARPFLSTWAAKLVATEARKQIGRATRDDPEQCCQRPVSDGSPTLIDSSMTLIDLVGQRSVTPLGSPRELLNFAKVAKCGKVI
jgi:hypothetical protein